MAEDPSPSPPVPIDRTAVDRVLARALELQAAGASDAEGTLTEAQLVALAREVGLDPIHLRQALAEERARVAVPADRGVLATMYGIASASAQRTVGGTPAEVLRALDEWMQRQESLTVQRYFPDRVVWETRRDVLSIARRVVSGRGHALARATTVTATAVALDARRSVVRLEAHLGGYRALMAQQNAGMATATTVVGGVLAMLNFPLIVAAAPLLVLTPTGVWAARASHRGAVTRAQLALEQVLDRLERGEAGRPPSLLGMLAAAVGGRR